MTKHGFTLAELVTVLLLLGVGASALVPTARRLSDEAWVAAAREIVVRGLSRGRAVAVAGGGSVVTVTRRPPGVRVESGGAVVYAASLGDGRTTVELGGSRDSLVLRYDGLGVGRFTSATVLVRRGDADAGLVLSSYGRVRRR